MERHYGKREYTVRYRRSKESDKNGVVRITGKGGYTGSVTKTFMVHAYQIKN